MLLLLVLKLLLLPPLKLQPVDPKSLRVLPLALLLVLQLGLLLVLLLVLLLLQPLLLLQELLLLLLLLLLLVPMFQALLLKLLLRWHRRHGGVEPRVGDRPPQRSSPASRTPGPRIAVHHGVRCVSCVSESERGAERRTTCRAAVIFSSRMTEIGCEAVTV